MQLTNSRQPSTPRRTESCAFTRSSSMNALQALFEQYGKARRKSPTEIEIRLVKGKGSQTCAVNSRAL
jgi:hypothetical protein